MSPSERLLLTLARPRHTGRFHESDDDFGVEHGIDYLYEQFGREILDHIEGKRVLDYGCRHGRQGAAYLLNGATHVTCVDHGNDSVGYERPLSEKYGVALRLPGLLGGRFECRPMPHDGDGLDLPKDFFDTIIMINMFQHFAQPDSLIRLCHGALKPGGSFIITFMRPWRHPYGGHLYFSMRLPWAHLCFSPTTLQRVSQRFWRGCPQCFTDVQGSLNRVTLRSFFDLADQYGFEIHFLKMRAVKRLHFLTKTPVLREFFTNRVSAILKRK